MIPLPLLALLAPVLAPHAHPAPAGQEPLVRTELGRRLDAHLERLEGLGFSGAVLVARGEELLLSKGYGLADRERGIPAGPGTVFPLGSITKHFTAAAVLTLYQDEALGLQDPLDVYFEDVPEDKRGITLHQLLCHTSGLSSGGTSTFGATTPDEYAKRVLATRLFFAPGTGLSYSNLGYGILAAVVEKVAGVPFEDYLRRALFEPLGMLHTGTRLAGWEPGSLAHGYVDGRDAGTLLDTMGDELGWGLRGSGGLQTTIGDMYLWNRGLDEGTVLEPATLELMTRPHAGGGRFAMGYGCGISRTATGHRMVGHNGSNDVFSADFRRYPDDGVLIFAAGNDADLYCFDVTPDLERLVLGEEVPAPPRVVSLEAGRLAAFAGEWVFEEEGTVHVEVAGETLVLDSGDVGAASLLHPVRPGQVGRRAELLEELALAYEAALGGDLAPLHELVDPQAGLEAFAERTGALLDALLQEGGEPLGVSTVPGRNRFGEVAIVVVVELENGRRRVEYSFGDREVGSIRGLDELPTRVVRPVGEGGFVSYDAAARETWEVAFELDGEGSPVALLLRDEAGREHRATRG